MKTRILMATVLLSMGLPVAQAMAALSCPTIVEYTDAAPTVVTQTVSVTTPALSNMRLFVFPAYRRGGGIVTISATHAGNAMTAATTNNYLDPMGGDLLYIDNPTAGTNDVVVTYGTTGLARGGYVVVCGDVDLAGGFRSVNQSTGNDTTPTVTLSSVQATDLILDCVASEVPSADPSTGQTVLDVGNNSEMNHGCAVQSGASGSTVAWSLTASQQWTEHAVVLKAIVGGGGGGSRRAISPMVPE